MAQAITTLKFSDTFNAYSAGTHIKNDINQDAVKTIKNMYNYNINDTQYSKLISDLPDIDILITMGCNVECPYISCKYQEDFGLDDPSNKCDDVFILTAKLIEEKIKNLELRIEANKITHLNNR
jgi:arsenate reductase